MGEIFTVSKKSPKLVYFLLLKKNRIFFFIFFFEGGSAKVWKFPYFFFFEPFASFVVILFHIKSICLQVKLKLPSSQETRYQIYSRSISSFNHVINVICYNVKKCFRSKGQFQIVVLAQNNCILKPCQRNSIKCYI